MKCKCGNIIPEARIGLGYKECVNCSTVEAVGCIDIVYHKTGNTIQITDKETAEKMRQLSRRTGFGTLRGMKPGPKSDTYRPKGLSRGGNLMARAVLPDPKIFEEVGKESLTILEIHGFDKALKFLQEKVENLWITPVQMGRIRAIMTALMPKEEKEPERKNSYYSKLEPKRDKPEVDDEIADAFKYWKR
jgi:hypothetical protein